MKPKLEISLSGDQNVFSVSVDDATYDHPRRFNHRHLRQQLGNLELVPAVLNYLNLRLEDHVCYVIHEGEYRRIVTNDGPAPPSRNFGPLPIKPQTAYVIETMSDFQRLHRTLNPMLHYVDSMTLVLDNTNGYFKIRQLGGPTWDWPKTFSLAKKVMLEHYPNYEHGYVVDGDFYELKTDADWVMAALTL